MNAQPGVTSPESFPIRDPKDPKQKNGQVVNPVRYGELGSIKQGGWPEGSDYAVEAPTSMKVAKPSGEGKVGGRNGSR
jgi:hypothetical protein